MSDPGVGTSPLNAERSIVASSPSELPQARKMKDESHIVGREDFANKLASQLIDEKGEHANLRVISVIGDGAIGKTALVRSVCNRANIKNHFDCCAWVWVGPKPNPVHLMADLLKQLRVPELQGVDLMDKEKLSDKLVRVLMGCCYLIVLDDLCGLHVMDELMMGLADSRNRSRVIVTTRNPHIPYSIDPWYFEPLTLSPLDEEQSKKLLSKCCPAFDVADLSMILLPLKETILRKSGGSPQKILLLGGLLSATMSDRRSDHTCRDRRSDLTYRLTNGLPDPAPLHDVVRLSVKDLPEGLKQCALYLTLFPKESEIPTGRLFRLWSAEDLVSSALENGAEECFETLVSRQMVKVARWKWDGSARSCRLPGSLYDVFYQMAENERFLKIYDCSIHDKKKFDAPRIAKYRDISGWEEAKAEINVPQAGRWRSETNAQEARMEITPADSMPFGIQELCSYVSFNTKKLGTPATEIAALLKPLVSKRAALLKPLVSKRAALLKPLVSKRDLSFLGVLDLEGVYKPLLPEELGNILPYLKYLGLRWTLLERLPKSVALLSHLETLDLKYTNISSLPESILEAKNLRHLYMTDVDFDCSIYQLFPRKSLNCNIQTIWGLEIKHGSLMFGVLSKLTGLRKLALTCRNIAVSEATKRILNLKMLKYLRLKDPFIATRWGNREMSDMSRLKSLSDLHLLGSLGIQSLLESHIPPNLKVLTLHRSTLNDDPMGVLGKLKCLTTLRLFANSYDGETLSVSEGTFPSLRVLKLWKLEQLTTWTIQANAMPCLADLEIKDCKKLKTIDGLQRIKNLEVITLIRVPEKLEEGIRAMQPNGPIIAKALLTEFDMRAEQEEQSHEEDSE